MNTTNTFRFVLCTLLLILSVAWQAPAKERVLIIQDEMPQMEVLAKYLEQAGDLDCEIVDQQHVPEDLSVYIAVIVYIHGDVYENAEVAFIDYTKKGGRCICLHHTISGSHGQNKYLFDFMGIRLDPGPPEKGGYVWIHGATLTLVNLNPSHYITSHQVKWGERIPYESSDVPSTEGTYSSISLPDSEVYLNHRFKDGREKTVLCGFKYVDSETGRIWMQDRGAWLKRYGDGILVYFQPGHGVSDYENPNISQMVLNAIRWKPFSAECGMRNAE